MKRWSALERGEAFYISPILMSYIMVILIQIIVTEQGGV